ncbi:hypothetical protein HYZ06_01580 [Candidatus Daviesbacteria bacterium]|nr:hypothetical protein [Candidatus Daviesbacteria bacterium]
MESQTKEPNKDESQNISSKKPVNRSTAYPAVGLQEAIELIKTLRKQLGKGPYDRSSIAKAIGYKGLNGASVVKIAALVHFGLLTRSGNVYTQSLLADSILLSTSEQEKEQAIIQASKTPKIYKSLIEKFNRSALPGLLTNIVVREYKIAEKVADKVAKDFKNTLEFSGLLQNGVIQDKRVEEDESAINQSYEESSEDKELSQRGPTQSGANYIPKGKSYPIDLPSGITIAFPLGVSYEVVTGEFGQQIKGLEAKAQEILKKKDKNSIKAESDPDDNSGGLA